MEGNTILTELFSTTREIQQHKQQIHISSDQAKDYQTTGDSTIFKFTKILNEIRHQSSVVDWGIIIWHRTIAKKFSFKAYKACMFRLPTIDRL